MIRLDREQKMIAASFGVAIIIILLLRGSGKGEIKQPLKATINEVDQKKSAKIILTAYMKAVEAGESQSELDKLNALFLKEYGMKVHPSNNGYVAKTPTGKEILIAK